MQTSPVSSTISLSKDMARGINANARVNRVDHERTIVDLLLRVLAEYNKQSDDTKNRRTQVRGGERCPASASRISRYWWVSSWANRCAEANWALGWASSQLCF